MGSPASVGGMSSKIRAAKIATSCGIVVWIGCPSREDFSLKAIIERGEQLKREVMGEDTHNRRGGVRRDRVSK